MNFQKLSKTDTNMIAITKILVIFVQNNGLKFLKNFCSNTLAMSM